jgi:hypothetical protein
MAICLCIGIFARQLSAELSALWTVRIPAVDQLKLRTPFPKLVLQSTEGPVALADRWREGPLVVAFMRHFG